MKICSLTTLFTLMFTGCVTDNEFTLDCSLSAPGISVSELNNPTDCASNDGRITVMVSGGEGPFEYSINGLPRQSSNNFTGLGSGEYEILVVDKNDCEGKVEAELNVDGLDLMADYSTSADTDCYTDNGLLMLSASGGTPPYVFRLGNESFGGNAIFEGLEPGLYSGTVMDADGCTDVVRMVVEQGTVSLDFSLEIRPILEDKCNTSGCHNGSPGPFNILDNHEIKEKASEIRDYVFSGNMPPQGFDPLTADERDLIICWIDSGNINELE